MSSLNSMARFESTLDCPASFEMDVQATYSALDTGDLTKSIPAPTTVPFTPLKAAEPSQSRFAPWLLSIAYPLGRFGLFPAYFGQVAITGQENLPRSGPVILAPTHRSRWDALVVPFVAGHHVTGRHLRFMVSADEVAGLQGWFIRRMGGFPINTNRPAIASLRHGVDLLEQGEVLVIFPEGNIFRENRIQPLKPGLARLAIQAETSRPHLGVRIVPMSIQYNNPLVPWRTRVNIHIGAPIAVEEFCTGRAKQDARSLTVALQTAMSNLL